MGTGGYIWKQNQIIIDKKYGFLQKKLKKSLILSYFLHKQTVSLQDIPPWCGVESVESGGARVSRCHDRHARPHHLRDQQPGAQSRLTWARVHTLTHFLSITKLSLMLAPISD